METFKNEYIIGKISKLFLILILLTTIINKSNAYVTVGPNDDSNCDYHSLALAISDVANLGTESIRLVGNNNGYEADGNILMYNKNISITGGYDSCLDNSSSHNNPSVISASSTGVPNISIVGISSTFETRLLLVSLQVKDGNNDKGAGVKITGNAHLTLNGAEIMDNLATEEGGGIHIKSGKLTVNYNSKITDNNSNSVGGGVYCEDGVINYFSGEVSYNNADYGAGLYLDNCQLNANIGSGNKIVSHNRGRFGVGIFALNETKILMGNNTTLTIFEDNQNTDISDSSGYGGALALKGQATTAKLVNSHFKSNKNSKGGAIYIFDNAYFSLESSNQCQLNNNYSGCASFENNKAYGYVQSYGGGGVVSCEVAGGHGGAINSHQSNVLLDGVTLHHNQVYREGCFGVDYVRGREPRGSVVYSKSSNIKLIDSLVFRNGGNHSKSIFYVENSRLDLIQTTITKNRTDVNATIRAVGSSPNIQLWGSIIAEGNTDIFDYSSGTNSKLMGECNMVSDLSDLTNGGYGIEDLLATVEDNPEFVNSSNDDYNLMLTSPAIDFCDFTTMQNTGFSQYFAKDINGNNRAYILTSAIYPMDLGAMEYSNGTFTGQSDLKLSVSGDTTSSLNGNIEYVFNVENLGNFSSDQAQLSINLDNNTGASWIDILPENPSDWNCLQNALTINCFVIGDFHTNRNISSLTINVSVDVIDVTTSMSAYFADYRSLDPNTNNNSGTINTVITGVSDVLFKNGFDD